MSRTILHIFFALVDLSRLSTHPRTRVIFVVSCQFQLHSLTHNHLAASQLTGLSIRRGTWRKRCAQKQPRVQCLPMMHPRSISNFHLHPQKKNLWLVSTPTFEFNFEKLSYCHNAKKIDMVNKLTTVNRFDTLHITS